MSDEIVLTYVLPIIFLLIGTGLLAGAAYHWAGTRRFLTKASKASGEVIALEVIPPQQPGADEYESYAPVVSFRTGFGQNVKFTSLSSSYPSSYSVGEKVPVLYLADGSEHPRIRTFHDLWLLPVLLAAFGLIFTVLGGWFLIGGIPQ